MGGMRYRTLYGCGRPVLGEQIMNYGWDAIENMVDYHQDEIRVNSSTPIVRRRAESEDIGDFGPDASYDE